MPRKIQVKFKSTEESFTLKWQLSTKEPEGKAQRLFRSQKQGNKNQLYFRESTGRRMGYKEDCVWKIKLGFLMDWSQLCYNF